jgi:hypothetical protein
MANRQDFIGWAKVARRVPLPQVDTSEIPLRSGRYGELYVQALVPSKAVLAEEGTYFTCTNPTPSTAIAYGSGGTQATFVDTVPFMQVLNTGNPGDPNAPVVYMDYLKLISNGTAPASTTHVEMAARLDNGFRVATAGTPTTNVPVSVNMNLATAQPASRVVTFSGAVATIPAISAAGRQVGRAMLKGGPTLNLDEYTVVHGINDGVGCQGYLTTVSAYTTRMPPVAIGPGQSLTYYLWFISGITNPFSYEFELGLWER